MNGLVIGALNDDSTVDTDFLADISQLANGMGLTYHRAIDQCLEPMAALDLIMQHGCERVLTSGLEANAFDGIPMLKQMVKHCGEHLAIMAGAGVNAGNVAQIVEQTGVREVHLSGKSTRPSLMQSYASSAHMGSADIDDFAIPVTAPEKIAAVLNALKAL